MKKPNFFIVGAAKAGTTSLYNYLNQHHDVYMCPIKEPNFFSTDINPINFRKNYKKSINLNIKKYLAKEKLEPVHIAFIKDLNDYLELFREVSREKVIGEISNSYLYSKVAAQEIYKFNSEAKIVMILRNPIDRAYSHFIMNLTEGIIDYDDFIEEVLFDYNKSQKGWGVSHLYIDLGLYYEQVKRFIDTFPRKNIKIIIYDEYIKNTKKTLTEIFDFLKIEDNINNIDFSKRYMEGYIPKQLWINIFLKKIYRTTNKFIPNNLDKILRKNYKNLMTIKKTPLSVKDRQKLLPIFKEDILKLSKLIDKDLSSWLKI